MKRIVITLAILLFCGSLFAKDPIVGISGYTEGGTHVANNTYISSVRIAGGVPLIIPVTTDDAQINAIVGIIDALIMTGGEDFDPLKWFGEEPVQQLGEIAPVRDEFDMKLVKAAVARGIPVLGICRGEQLINIAFGGTLYQDIPSQVKGTFVKHRQGTTPGSYPTHSINIEKGSVLERLLNTNNIAVNSFHHQAVKDLAPCFKVTATAADGIVEAIERVEPLHNYKDGGALIMGVQFHPEIFTSAGNKKFLEIFKYLVQEARK